jgi:hypothetical protein
MLAVPHKRPVLTTATQRNIPEDGILHSHRLEDLKSYIIVRIYVDTAASIHFITNTKRLPTVVFITK